MADVDTRDRGGSLVDQLPVDRLKGSLQDAFSAAVGSVSDRLTGATDRLSDAGSGIRSEATKEGTKAAVKGKSPVMGAIKGGLSGLKDKAKDVLSKGSDGGGKGGPGKVINIVEQIDVGVPIDVAYNAWTEFQEFSGFMKKVEQVEQTDETKVRFKAQVFWSHREWEGQILQQVPDEQIVWRSKAKKGSIDGAVTFHELAPRLTRILVVLEYHPQGLFERTGNLWRAQGRRARLELKHFRRHLMTEVIRDQEAVEGWRGEIDEGEVTRSHEEAVEGEHDEEEGAEDEDEDVEPEDELDEEEELDEDEEDEEEEEPEDEEGDEEDEDEEDELDEEDEGEEDEDEEPASTGRSRRSRNR